MRVAILKAQFPGLKTEGQVQIARGCDIYVGQGSTLLIRGCAIAPGVTLVTAPGATLDLDADFVGPGSVIVAREHLSIGAGTKIAEGVTVRDANHDMTVPIREMKFVSAPVRVGPGVWLGAKSTVLAGVTIGEAATVAAGAVVTRDVDARQVVGGVPARPIRAG